MFLTSKREAVQWIHDAWRFKHGDRCVKFNQTPWWHVSFKFLQFQFRITSIQIVSFLIFFPILFWLCGNIPYSFFNKNYWKYVYFLYATFFACRMPTLSLWIFFKDLSVVKITEKCSICYHFLFRMYCVRTRFSLRPSCDQNFGKYVYMVNLLLQRIF